MQQRGVNKGNNNHPDNTLHAEEESIPVSGMFGKGGHGTGHVVQLFIVFSTSIFPSSSSLDRCKKKKKTLFTWLAAPTGSFLRGCQKVVFLIFSQVLRRLTGRSQSIASTATGTIGLWVGKSTSGGKQRFCTNRISIKAEGCVSALDQWIYWWTESLGHLSNL